MGQSCNLLRGIVTGLVQLDLFSMSDIDDSIINKFPIF